MADDKSILYRIGLMVQEEDGYDKAALQVIHTLRKRAEKPNKSSQYRNLMASLAELMEQVMEQKRHADEVGDLSEKRIAWLKAHDYHETDNPQCFPPHLRFPKNTGRGGC